MPKLSEISTTDNLKMLIYGKAGAGKTCFAAGFPYPMLYLDFDGKVDSAALFYKEDKERLENIDVRDLSARMENNPIQELETIIDKELIPQEKSGEMKFKTLVIDSITTFSASVLKHIVKTNPGIKRIQSKQGVQPGMQDYGILKREFARLVPGILGLPCNVIMLGHISVTKDDLTGELVRGPLMDGSFANELPIYFKEVWRAYRDDKGNHLAQTQANFKFDCRSQIPGLANPAPLSYSEIEKHIK